MYRRGLGLQTNRPGSGGCNANRQPAVTRWPVIGYAWIGVNAADLLHAIWVVEFTGHPDHGHVHPLAPDSTCPRSQPLMKSHEAVRLYFEHAADRLDLDASMRRLLLMPKREVQVEIPVEMDSG